MPILWWDGGQAKPSTISSCKLPEHTTHLHSATYITAKEFSFSSPHTHPNSIPVTDQCCYRHGTNWSEIQEIYTAAEGRKTPCLKSLLGFWEAKKAIKAPLMSFITSSHCSEAAFFTIRKAGVKPGKHYPAPALRHITHFLQSALQNQVWQQSLQMTSGWIHHGLEPQPHSLKQAAFCPLVFKTFHVHGTLRDLDR